MHFCVFVIVATLSLVILFFLGKGMLSTERHLILSVRLYCESHVKHFEGKPQFLEK